MEIDRFTYTAGILGRLASTDHGLYNAAWRCSAVLPSALSIGPDGYIHLLQNRGLRSVLPETAPTRHRGHLAAVGARLLRGRGGQADRLDLAGEGHGLAQREYGNVIVLGKNIRVKKYIYN